MGEHCKGGKSKPVNLGLYNRIKSMVKRKVKRWPSAYASGQVVRMYKQKGGKYRCTSKSSKFGESGLNRWFKERWVDVCTGKPCGRNPGEKRKYPYCRPSRRISSKTPKFKIPLSVLKKRCAIKHRIKGKRITGFGTKDLYTLDLSSKSSIMSLKKTINQTQPNDCLNWKNCKSWTYFISEEINSKKPPWNIIKFKLVRKPYKIDKKPSRVYNKYIKKSKGYSVSFYSLNGQTQLVIPRKPYINLNDFAFNSSDTEWFNLWNHVYKQLKNNDIMKCGPQVRCIGGRYFITTHGHGVNWFHVRIEKELKYNM